MLHMLHQHKLLGSGSPLHGWLCRGDLNIITTTCCSISLSLSLFLSLSLSPVMAAEHSNKQTSNNQLLQELEALNQSLYQTHTTTRRTASLALPRTSVPSISSDEAGMSRNEEKLNPKQQQRRMSLSLWRSRPKPDDENQKKERKKDLKLDDRAASSARKGLWNWKPIRALSHIGMQKLSCLFSVEVVAVQDLPPSMNGLRLSVCVKKKETKDGAVHTMPSRVSQGAADFEEILFIRCHVYCTPGSGTQLQFEPRPFFIYVFPVDAEELDFGRSSVDLSRLIQESVYKCSEGTRVRQWDASFNLSGKAKGGELILKLGFQLMEKDGGIGIYNQAEGQKATKGRNFWSIGCKQSKSSFSIPSPRMSSQAEAWTPSQSGTTADFQGIDELNLDEPASMPSSSPSVQKFHEQESRIEDLDLPKFDILDKGVEIQDETETEGGQSEEISDKRSVSSEFVKEIVRDQVHLTRLTQLASIVQKITALKSIMGDENPVKTEEETASQRLDAEEETATREFLQMLEDEEANKFKLSRHDASPLKLKGAEDSREAETKVFVPELGKGLGCVVQTRDGGYLAAMNPLGNAVARKDTPKLAIQISKPLVLPSTKSTNGFVLFQSMAAVGLETLGSEILSLMPVDELKGKTAEQIAFEGIASAIIQGRNKEGASSSAASTIAAVKTMATAMSTGRKERISTGIWNLTRDPLTVDEILAFSMQKIEAMAVEALKIQAEMTEEDAPFDVSSINEERNAGSGKDRNHPLASAVPLEDWIKMSSNTTFDTEAGDSATITISVVVQLRDPARQYEAVGGPVIVLINAIHSDAKRDNYDEEKRFKLASLHVGGLKVRTGGNSNVWDTEKQRLTAMHWLVAYGLGKARKKRKHALSKGQDVLWSISSQVMADTWLKPMRNPDVKFTN